MTSNILQKAAKKWTETKSSEMTSNESGSNYLMSAAVLCALILRFCGRISKSFTYFSQHAHTHKLLLPDRVAIGGIFVEVLQ